MGVPESGRGRRRDLGEPRNSSGNVCKVQSLLGAKGHRPRSLRPRGFPAHEAHPPPSSLGRFRGPPARGRSDRLLLFGGGEYRRSEPSLAPRGSWETAPWERQLRGVGVSAAWSPGEMANELGLGGMDSWVLCDLVPEGRGTTPSFYYLVNGFRVEPNG